MPRAAVPREEGENRRLQITTNIADGILRAYDELLIGFYVDLADKGVLTAEREAQWKSFEILRRASEKVKSAARRPDDGAPSGADGRKGRGEYV